MHPRGDRPALKFGWLFDEEACLCETAMGDGEVMGLRSPGGWDTPVMVLMNPTAFSEPGFSLRPNHRGACLEKVFENVGGEVLPALLIGGKRHRFVSRALRARYIGIFAASRHGNRMAAGARE